MEKRTTVLMAVLLLLLAGYLARPQIESYLWSDVSRTKAAEPPLAGENKISNLRITKNNDGTYMAHFNYFYRGEPVTAFISVFATNDGSTNSEIPTYIPVGPPRKAERGQHTADIEIGRPAEQDELVTRKVIAWMGGAWQNHPTTQIVDYAIDWPDFGTYEAKQQLIKTPNDMLYKTAVSLIDAGDNNSLNTAKKSLEQILIRDANYIPAYPELARVAMKSNWGPEGLRQAEKYLLSALAINAKHANTKVLLGYVYAHQQRYTEAETQLSEAASIGTNNLWLWANWGELLLMENKVNEALEKYMRAVSGGRTYDTYDRARIDAYSHLFAILEEKHNFDQMDALHKKRDEEFGDKFSCFYGEYGDFRLTHYGDYGAGIENAKKAVDSGCTDDAVHGTLGISYYFAWHRLTGDEKAKALNQARAIVPEGPGLFYQLAKSEITSAVIPELVRNGSSINLQDNKKLNALAYALAESDLDAVRRLVKSGAMFNAVVGDEQYPVALIPIFKQDVKGVELMKECGVNFAEIKFNGATALDYARKLGNQEIVTIIEGNSKVKL